jgi:hypothetical protein
MEINIKKKGKIWMVEFTHGVQTFTLDYHVTEKDEADWMKDRLTSCFSSAFGENWHENSGLTMHSVMKSVCQCSEPINQMTNNGMYCLRCENPVRQTVL